MSNDFFKKHIDTAVILSSVIASILWMNTRFNQVDNRFNELEKEMVVIKTVMILKNILPAELANNDFNSKNVSEQN